jgi:hypothetical protein
LHGCILMYIGFNKVGYVYETGDYYMKSTVWTNSGWLVRERPPLGA